MRFGGAQVVEDESVPPLAEALFADGDFPSALDRINFGALVLGPLWALAYGAWAWCLGLIAARIVPLAVYVLAGPSVDEMPVVILTWGFWVLYFVPVVVFAFRANHIAWLAAQRAATRPRGQHALVRNKSVGRFRAEQRVWTWVALATLVAAPLLNLTDDYGNLDPARVRAALLGYAATFVILIVLVSVDAARRKSAAAKLTKVSSRAPEGRINQ